MVCRLTVLLRRSEFVHGWTIDAEGQSDNGITEVVSVFWRVWLNPNGVWQVAGVNGQEMREKWRGSAVGWARKTGRVGRRREHD